MALDKAFFDSIDIEVVKKKYYNANKVRALLETIQNEAAALTEENHRLRKEASGLSAQKAEISDTLISAQTLVRQISDKATRQAREHIREAEAKASAITEAAEKRAAALTAEAETRAANIDKEAREMAQKINMQQQEYAASCVEACFEMLKKQQEENIAEIKEKWRGFLCGLSPEDAEETAQPESMPTELPTLKSPNDDAAAEEDEDGYNPIRPTDADESAFAPNDADEFVVVPPADLKAKISAIAEELEQISSGETGM